MVHTVTCVLTTTARVGVGELSSTCGARQRVSSNVRKVRASMQLSGTPIGIILNSRECTLRYPPRAIPPQMDACQTCRKHTTSYSIQSRAGGCNHTSKQTQRMSGASATPNHIFCFTHVTLSTRTQLVCLRQQELRLVNLRFGRELVR